MAIDYLVGWTQGELETELRRCQQELLKGKTLIGSGAGDLNFSHRVEQDITERIKMILRKLSKLAPATYPATDTTPIDRTQYEAPKCL